MKKLLVLLVVLLSGILFYGCDSHECVSDKWIYPVGYSCGDNIKIKKVCNECGEVIEEKIITADHILKESIINPTCTEKGYTLVKCETCDYEEKKDYVDEISHDMDDVVINPTCVSEGYTISKCKNCDFEEKKDIIAKSEHSLIEEVVEATCSEKGYVYSKCINCDFEEVKSEIDKLPHITNENDEWVIIEDNGCEEDATFAKLCTVCGEVVESYVDIKFHDYQYETIPSTCTEKGYEREYCSNCDYEWKTKYKPALGHQNTKYVVDVLPTDGSFGQRHLECDDCGYKFAKVNYLDNGYAKHGKLRVAGANLLDQSGNPVQLIGLSTHGMQWATKYINFESLEQVKSEFGINVVRFALYTSEDGYCDSTPAKKQELYDLLCKGIEAATKLDMYVIVDWHMVGADNPEDKNPLYYLEESKDLFKKISTKYKDYHNILYEIMNEPNGPTTWEDCKKYANEIIPIIRENTSNIVLVGNPKWTADLNSVMASPLEGYTNIMYTYHFYAADHQNKQQVITAYDKGFPVFISEHGGMESSGDGALDIEAITAWYKVLDERNISYVAWNISNTKGSASILKTTTSSSKDFSDNALKEWGIWYKRWVRSKMGVISE